MNAPAYRHNEKPVARETFYAIACDPRRSVAVEACAGAGKTWMLVSRIVRALLAGTKPQEILAITFTRKAAGEMRQRLAQWLAEWSAAPPEKLREALAQRGLPDADDATCARLKGLHAELLAAGRPVQVRTFHSWFAALLGAAPLSVLEEMGFPAHYQLLMDDAEARARVWRRFHIAVAADPAARADYQASIDAYGRSSTIKALGAVLAKRIEFTLADRQGVLDDSVKTVGEQFEAFTGLDDPAHALARPAWREPLLEAARGLGRASARTFAAKGVELEEALTGLNLPGVIAALMTEGKPRAFSDKVPDLEAVRRAQDIVLQLMAAQAQHEAWRHHGRMSRLGRVLLREFAALKREQGWVDMNDVEMAAMRMLGDPVLSGFVQERLDAQVRHLLIDEFQDTNPLQWQALGEWLRSYAGAGAGAPAVFIVGDPKQSIYRFRRAEPRVFHEAQRFIAEALGGDRLSSDHTRRCSPAVVQTVNTVFLAAEQEQAFTGFREHTTQSDAHGSADSLPPIRPEPEPEADAGGAAGALEWRDSLTVPRVTPEERLATLESRQVAAWIAAEVRRGTKYKDIMVLARRRARLSELEEELRELRIPALQPEKTDLCEVPEVQDIVALFDALVTPTHDLSLARALRSPVFGLADQSLAALALMARGEKPAPSWFELLQRPGLPGELQAAGERLARWKSWVDTLPPHDALGAIYRDADLLARYAASAPDALRESMLANLRALVGAALEVQGGRYLTPYAFVRALRSTPIPGPAIASGDVVRLLTVHGAKGLEASRVLLLDTDGAPPPAETMGVLCEWPGEAAAPTRFAFVANENRPPPCTEQAMQDEQRARSREELNALYVAMTRAEHKLILSAVEPSRRGSGLTWWERVQPLCAPLDAPQAPSALQDASGDAVILPVLPSVTFAKRRAEAAPPQSEVARFGSAVHRLLEHSDGAGTFAPSRLRKVAREFGLDGTQAERAAGVAARILTGDGRWAWRATEIDWQGNEVELIHRGESLRIDRLVRRTADGCWWVLDYKSAFAPEQDEALLAQMRRYREAVLATHPGASVKLAFLTGEGRLVEVD